MNAEIASKMEDIHSLCEQHGVAKLDLFGSASRDDFDPETSDFDFLVEFLVSAPGTDYGYRFLAFVEALEESLGRPIDVLTPNGLTNRHFREEIAETRQELYRATNAVAA